MSATVKREGTELEKKKLDSASGAVVASKRENSEPDGDLTYKTVWSYHVHGGRRVTCSTVAHQTQKRPTCWTRTLWIRLPPFLSAKLWLRYGYSLEDVYETLDCYQSYDLWHLALALGGTLSNQAVKQSFATTDYASIGSMHNTCGGRATVLERDRVEIAKGYPQPAGVGVVVPSVLRHNRVRAANASHQSARQQGAVRSPWALAGLRDVNRTIVQSSLSITTVPPLKLKFMPPDAPTVNVDLETFHGYEKQIATEQREFDLTLPDASLTPSEMRLVHTVASPDVRLLVQMIRTTPPLQFKDISVVPICRDGSTGYLLMRRVVPDTTYRFHTGKPYCMFFQPLRAVIAGKLYAFTLEQFWISCPGAAAVAPAAGMAKSNKRSLTEAAQSQPLTALAHAGLAQLSSAAGAETVNAPEPLIVPPAAKRRKGTQAAAAPRKRKVGGAPAAEKRALAVKRQAVMHDDIVVTQTTDMLLLGTCGIAAPALPLCLPTPLPAVMVPYLLPPPPSPILSRDDNGAASVSTTSLPHALLPPSAATMPVPSVSTEHHRLRRSRPRSVIPAAAAASDGANAVPTNGTTTKNMTSKQCIVVPDSTTQAIMATTPGTAPSTTRAPTQSRRPPRKATTSTTAAGRRNQRRLAAAAAAAAASRGGDGSQAGGPDLSALFPHTWSSFDMLL